MTEDRDNGRPATSPGQWDRYWAHGFLTSCADAFSNNYEGAIGAAWQQFFADLKPSARVLDVCTGNGAVAALAADWALSNDAGFQIDAIDLARIQPESALKDRPDILARIRFHACTPADATPFDAAVFGAIVGQYALEYAPLTSTIAELARVAAPGCRVMFIMHHAGSIVLETTREELRHGDLLFKQTRLFEHTQAFIQYVGTAAQGRDRQSLSADSRAETLRVALNRSAAQVSDAVKGSAHPELLTNALTCVGEAYKRLDHWGVGGALESLERGRQEILLNLERLEDLQKAALADDGREALGKTFRDAGFFTPRFDIVRHHDERILGWQLLTVRRA